MKRLFLICLAILLIAGIAFAATPGYRQNPGTGDILGQGKYQQDPHKIFRMVRYVPVTYAGATTLAADSIVVWDTGEDDGVTVTTTTLSADTTVAGIIVTQALTPDTDGNDAEDDVGQGNWTWLQTYGLSQVNLATGSNSQAGSAMGTSTTAGEATVFSVLDSGRHLQYGFAGFFYDADTAGADDVECFLRALD